MRSADDALLALGRTGEPDAMNNFTHQVVLADCAAPRRDHFRLRHQVFCQEYRFEPPEQHPEGLERDAHDTQSVHFLVGPPDPASRVATPWVGAMRLVRPAPLALPMKGVLCPDGVAAGGLDGRHRSILEVSRLLLRPEARGGRSPVMIYLLCRAAWAYAMQHGFEELYFMVTPALARFVRGQGLPLQVFAPPVDHRGVRLPCRVSTTDLGAGLRVWRGRLPGPVPATPYLSYAEHVARPEAAGFLGAGESWAVRMA